MDCAVSSQAPWEGCEGKPPFLPYSSFLGLLCLLWETIALPYPASCVGLEIGFDASLCRAFSTCSCGSSWSGTFSANCASSTTKPWQLGSEIQSPSRPLGFRVHCRPQPWGRSSLPSQAVLAVWLWASAARGHSQQHHSRNTGRVHLFPPLAK